jgi:hypothetical protein
LFARDAQRFDQRLMRGEPMTTTAPAEKTGRHQRSVKNYLIDSRFQLKYTGFIVGATLLLSVILGVFLYTTSNKVVEESKTVSDMVKMQIKDDPVYGSDPDLAKAVSDSTGDSDNKVLKQQRAMMTGVVGGLTVLVLLIGLLGIYFTHKVAGPVHKMKGLLIQVGEGKLVFSSGLRKGDELQDFFETFQTMVGKLRERQVRDIELLDAALTEAKASGASEVSLVKIIEVRDEMKRSLEDASTRPTRTSSLM